MSASSISGYPHTGRSAFREGGDRALQAAAIQRTGFNASQVCHHPRLAGRKETHLCRGARDHQLTLLYRLGMIPEATDAAFAAESAKQFGT